jgi:hypothetical protein
MTAYDPRVIRLRQEIERRLERGVVLSQSFGENGRFAIRIAGREKVKPISIMWDPSYSIGCLRGMMTDSDDIFSCDPILKKMGFSDRDIVSLEAGFENPVDRFPPDDDDDLYAVGMQIAKDYAHSSWTGPIHHGRVLKKSGMGK